METHIKKPPANGGFSTEAKNCECVGISSEGASQDILSYNPN